MSRAVEIFSFEIRYQARRAATWLSVLALIAFAFLFTRDGSLSAATYEDTLINAPFTIAGAMLFSSILWLLLSAPVAGEAAARDVATGMSPLVYTAPVRKRELLAGRFLAALALNAAIMLGAVVGHLLAVYLPGVHPDAIGPFRPEAYLSAYVAIALTNVCIGTTLQFAFAALSGRPMAAYVASVLLFLLTFGLGAFLYTQGRTELSKLVEPVGIMTLTSEMMTLWTPVEKQTRLVRLEGTLLWNRMLWMGIAVAVAGLTYARVRLDHPVTRGRRWRLRWRARPEGARPALARVSSSDTATVTALPAAAPAHGPSVRLHQLWAIAWTSCMAIAKSWAGLGLLVVVTVLTVPVVIDQMVSDGVRMTPATVLVLGELTGSLTNELSRWAIVPLLIVLFAGDLVWRVRDARLDGVTGAMPVPTFVQVCGRLLGLALVLAMFVGAQMAAGLTAQTLLGYRSVDPSLYVTVLFGLQLPEYLLFAVLAFAIHVLVNHRYVGHVAASLAFVGIALAPMFGIEHDLLVYGASPRWSYTEMRGFGPTLAPWLWFTAYWTAWSVLLIALATAFWMRGRDGDVQARWRRARARYRRPMALTIASAGLLVVGLGGWIFYNTNIRNVWLSSADRAARSAAYERNYARFADAPQPSMTSARLRVDIHPERRAADISGTYGLVNRSATPIDAVHVTTALGASTTLSFDSGSTEVVTDDTLGYRVHRLPTPLAPGASLKMTFAVRYQARGFREDGADTSIVENGTFFQHTALPAIGYQRTRELIAASDRREHGLPARPVVPSLDAVEARTTSGGGIDFEAVVGTSADQIGVAPGGLRRQWTEGHRRYFHYVSDGPIGHEWAFASARYSLHEAQWVRSDGAGNGVRIAIFHHPEHAAHVDRMLDSIRASLDYYTRHFGPYRYGHLTVVEHPGNGVGLHAEASMLTHSEGFAFWSPGHDPATIDLLFAIVGHEMAHQWTVPYAFAEGGPVMSESIAWYYAMRMAEARFGAQIERLRRFMRQPQPYPPIRRGEPLLRGLDPYLAYRKGPMALYTLSEYVGEAHVNTALRRLVETHTQPDAPLATTRDLYRELLAVTSAQHRALLHDLFEVSTTWDLATERASAEPLDAATWRVTLDVRARKFVTDAAGVDTDVKIDDFVEVGVFDEDGAVRPAHRSLVRVDPNTRQLTLVVPFKPVRAGIDPRLLLDLDGDDNTVDVETATEASRGRVP